MNKIKRIIACLALIIGLGGAAVIADAAPASASPYVWVSWNYQYYQDGSRRGAAFVFHDTATYGYNNATTLKRGVIQCNNGTTLYTLWYYTAGSKTLLCSSGYHMTNTWTESG